MIGAVRESAGFTLITGVDPTSIPERLALSLVGAHPIRSNARFQFELPRDGHVSLRVFDVTGRRMATIVDGALPAGRHETSWGARTSGRSSTLPAGVYIAELSLDGERRMKRFVVLP